MKEWVIFSIICAFTLFFFFILDVDKIWWQITSICWGFGVILLSYLLKWEENKK